MNEKTKTYEGMFLLEAGTPNFETACEPIRKVLDRSQAEILSIKPWDERKLAYEVKHNKRGLYVLTYFRADPAGIAELEQDCQLNEQILRVLILHRDHLSDEQISADTPATVAKRRAAQAAERQAAAKAKAEAEQPPADEQPKPAVEPAKPADEQPKPADEPAKPADEQPKPAVEPADKPPEPAEPQGDQEQTQGETDKATAEEPQDKDQQDKNDRKDQDASTDGEEPKPVS